MRFLAGQQINETDSIRPELYTSLNIVGSDSSDVVTCKLYFAQSKRRSAEYETSIAGSDHEFARIKTTVVGSYPVPSWLVGNTSRLVLRDAVMAVMKTQELAGLDLLTDGELMRFDPSHPETNGMVDYFASQLDGIRKHFALSDFDRFRSDRASGYRLLTAGMVVGKIRRRDIESSKRLRICEPAHQIAAEVHLHGPHMLARLLTNCFYSDVADLAMDIAVVLRRQLAMIEANMVQLDEACIAGYPEDAPWAAEAINHVLDGF